MTTVNDIYNYINEIAPYENMEEWDNSGFILGDMSREVGVVSLSLDATKKAAEFAKSVGAQLALTHHPIIFNPLKKIYKGSAVYEFINADIAVMCAHTSFDKAGGGINDNLAAILGLENTYTLDNGYVVCGELAQSMSIDDFALFVSQRLHTHGLRYTDTDNIIKRVCVGGGACSEFLDEARAVSDCFVTSDVKYHTMLDASETGYALIDAGHYETENEPFLMLKDKLEKRFTDVKFLIAPVDNPVLEL